MGIVEFSLLLIVAFVLIVRYQMAIQEAALMERYHLIENIKKIIEENALTDREETFLLNMLKSSTDSLFIPKAILYGIFNYKNTNIKSEDSMLDSLFHKVKKEFFAVNLIAGLHWYVILGLFLSILALIVFTILLPFIAFSKARKAFKLLYGIEHRASATAFYPFAIARMV